MLKVCSMLPRSCIGRRTQTMIDIAHTIVSVASDQWYEFNATNGAIDDYALSYLTSIMTGSTAFPGWLARLLFYTGKFARMVHNGARTSNYGARTEEKEEKKKKEKER